MSSKGEEEEIKAELEEVNDKLYSKYEYVWGEGGGKERKFGFEFEDMGQEVVGEVAEAE